MKKFTTNILAYSLSLALVAGCLAFGSTPINAAKENEDGDVITNPWEEMFTTGESGSSSDIEIPTTTKNNVSEKETTNNSSSSTTTKVAIGKTKVKKVKRLKSNKKKAKVTLKKIKDADGYQIKYSTSKKFKKKKSKTVNTKKTVKTIKKLKTNKKYYVKARAYRKVNGKKKYGKWSKVKTLKKVN